MYSEALNASSLRLAEQLDAAIGHAACAHALAHTPTRHTRAHARASSLEHRDEGGARGEHDDRHEDAHRHQVEAVVLGVDDVEDEDRDVRGAEDRPEERDHEGRRREREDREGEHLEHRQNKLLEAGGELERILILGVARHLRLVGDVLREDRRRRDEARDLREREEAAAQSICFVTPTLT